MNDATIITAPSSRDVLQGRGQGVQRHPGNIKYRKLVFVNKGLYAKCPRADKVKISRGIVAAIRESGGRFLEHNERLDTYTDIGDKKAVEKTSQALREGQKEIRKKIYKTEEAALASSTGPEETRQFSNLTMPVEPEAGQQLPAEDYSQYSMLVLEALYNSDKSLPTPPAQAQALPQQVKQQTPPLPPPQHISNGAMYGVPNNAYMGTSTAAMAMALDQFPGARMPMHRVPQHTLQQIQHPMQQMHHQPQHDPRAQFITGTNLSYPSFRLTDMSLGSAFSIGELLESIRNSEFQARNSGARGIMESRLSVGTIDMIRQSQLQLLQIDKMEFEDLNPSQGEIDSLFDRNTVDQGEGRISDMRFSDLSKDRFTDFREKRPTECTSDVSSHVRFSDLSKDRSTYFLEKRLTESTSDVTSQVRFSDLSKDRSTDFQQKRLTESSSGVSSHDSDMAELLLGLANSDGNKSDKMED